MKYCKFINGCRKTLLWRALMCKYTFCNYQLTIFKKIKKYFDDMCPFCIYCHICMGFETNLICKIRSNLDFEQIDFTLTLFSGFNIKDHRKACQDSLSVRNHLSKTLQISLFCDTSFFGIFFLFFGRFFAVFENIAEAKHKFSRSLLPYHYPTPTVSTTQQSVRRGST